MNITTQKMGTGWYGDSEKDTPSSYKVKSDGPGDSLSLDAECGRSLGDAAESFGDAGNLADDIGADEDSSKGEGDGGTTTLLVGFTV